MKAKRIFLILMTACLCWYAKLHAQPCPLVTSPSGIHDMCVGNVLSIAVTGAGTSTETWGPSSGAIITVAGTGGSGSGTANITAVGAGSRNVFYSDGAGATCSYLIRVHALPTVNAITGTFHVCVGNTTSLSDLTVGGTWSSTAPAVGTVDAVSGVVTGLTAGVTTISYTVSNGFCTAAATVNVTVNALPSVSIGGPSSICHGTTVTLNPTPGPGGLWSAGPPATLTIGSASGVVTAGSPGTGGVQYAYTDANGCTNVATHLMTIDPTPNAGSISGTLLLCPGGSTTTLTSSGDPGGVWSSLPPGVASIGSSSGIVTSGAPGVANVTYTVSNSCGNATATAQVTVNPMPNAGFTPDMAVCITNTVTCTSTGDPGGVWTSGNTSIATIGSSSGVATGISVGSAPITYTVTNLCGTSTATCNVTVQTTVSVAPVTGPTSVCASGGTITEADVTGGGGFASSNTSIATVDNVTGVVTGVAAGTVNISYIVINSCGLFYNMQTVTVNPLPNPGTITGGNICHSTSSTFTTDGDPGGVWTSSSTGVATVGSTSGMVTAGSSAGTVTITYTATTAFGCTAYSIITITVDAAPNPGTITGTLNVCPYATTTLHSTGDVGGTWTSSNTSLATIGSANGLVIGVAAGNPNMTYTVTNSCGTASVSATVTVNPDPVAGTVTGPSTGCTGSVMTYTVTGGDPGGTWSSSNTAVGTIDASGNLYGIADGTTTILYTVTNVCGSAYGTPSSSLTLGTDPGINISSVTGTYTGPWVAGTYYELCQTTGSITFTGSPSGGTWTSLNTSLATISSSGVVSINSGYSIANYETMAFRYDMSNACGYFYVLGWISVDAPSSSILSISGPTSVTASSTTPVYFGCLPISSLGGMTLSNYWSVSGGSFYTSSVENNNPGILFPSPTTATVYYNFTNTCGTQTTSMNVTVH